MTTTRLNYLVPAVLGILSLTSSAALGQRFVGPVTTKRVKFEKGRTTAVIKGIARTPGTYEYALRGRSGQVMTLHLTSSNKGC